MLAAVHPHDRDRVRRELEAAVDGRAPFRSEFRVGAAGGTVRWLAGHGRWLDDAGAAGGPDGSPGLGRMVGVYMDVTGRHRAEEELRLLNEMLEERVEQRTRELAETQAALVQAQKMEAVGQLTGGIAHNFNNLFQVVEGSLEVVGDEPLTDRQRRALDTAMRSADRGSRLTKQLLAFARKCRLEPRPTNLNALFIEFGDMLGATLGSRVEMELNLKQRLPHCLVDPTHLEMALLNVLINARDAMAPKGGGTVTVSTALVRPDAHAAAHDRLAPGEYVALSVRDGGPGMPAHVLERATEPFFITRDVGKGTGLGLAMVQGFVQQSRGRLEIDSAPGKGTTVRMLFPTSAQAAALEDDPGRPPRAGRDRAAAGRRRPARRGGDDPRRGGQRGRARAGARAPGQARLHGGGGAQRRGGARHLRGGRGPGGPAVHRHRHARRHQRADAGRAAARAAARAASAADHRLQRRTCGRRAAGARDVRRVFRAVPAPRSTFHSRPRRPGQAILRKRIRELAETRVRYG